MQQILETSESEGHKKWKNEAEFPKKLSIFQLLSTSDRAHQSHILLRACAQNSAGDTKIT